MNHARRKFYDLYVTDTSGLAEQALRYIAALYEIEREASDLEPDVRRRLRQEKAAPLKYAFHDRMITQRERMHEGLGIAKAQDYNAQALDRVESLLGRRHGAHRQQPHRKSDEAMGAWAQQLVVRRFTTQRSGCGGVVELDPVG